MGKGLTDWERYLLRIESLALSTLPVPDGLLAAAPTHHDGVMVALVPDSPEDLAIDHEEALPADDLHITLCYFGKIQDLTSLDKARILAKARIVCNEQVSSFSASADGVIIMGSNDDGVPATALLVQSDEIVALYDALSDALDYKSKYPSFIPHMTLGYGVPAEDAEKLVGSELRFSNVIVKFGNDVHTIPLSSAIVAAPRGANVIDRVIDSLGRLWDEALHPRDAEGRFIKKNGAVSGKLAVPTKDRKGVTMVDANRASVVGFHTFGEEVWVLAEIKNQDGSVTQGFARATDVRATAPVKARLDALYPIDESGDAFINSSLERKRQLDLILAHITSEYGPSNDEDGAFAFLESLGLRERDLDYMLSNDDMEFLGGIREVDRDLTDDELDEQEDIINDARQVKELRARVHGLKEDPDLGFSAEDAHVQPKQQLTSAEAVDQEVVAALKAGSDPLSLDASNLLGAMRSSDRFDTLTPKSATGISEIFWLVDPEDVTEHNVKLAGMGESTNSRAFFVKASVIGAELGNTDVVHEVVVSLMAEDAFGDAGQDASSLMLMPKSRFGDNPRWDGNTPHGTGDIFDEVPRHQPAHVVSQHGAYLVPSDWRITDAATEEAALQNDLRGLDDAAQADQRAAFYEDMGDLYGNSVAQMVLWDFIVLNGDRNAGNAMLASPPDGLQGKVVLIDHGFTFDEPFEEGNSQSTFEWFMEYHLTKAWLNYIRGGLDLGNNVTEESLRESVEEFLATYSQMDADRIKDAFRSLEGVLDDQIENSERDIDGALDRLRWVSDNIETVLSALTGRSGP